MLTIYPVAIFQYTIIYHFNLTGIRGGGAQPRAINYQPNIFGQKPSFQTKYFRRRRDFSIFFICLNRADLVFLTFDDGYFDMFGVVMFYCITQSFRPFNRPYRTILLEMKWNIQVIEYA
jgi:hypothetical protein